MGFGVGSKVKRQSRHGNNLHPHSSGSILPLNLASDRPMQEKPLKTETTAPPPSDRKGKIIYGELGLGKYRKYSHSSAHSAMRVQCVHLVKSV